VKGLARTVVPVLVPAGASSPRPAAGTADASSAADATTIPASLLQAGTVSFEGDPELDDEENTDAKIEEAAR